MREEQRGGPETMRNLRPCWAFDVRSSGRPDLGGQDPEGDQRGRENHGR